MCDSFSAVAAEALATYDLVDRPSREQRYYLALLEPEPVEEQFAAVSDLFLVHTTWECIDMPSFTHRSQPIVPF
jgi:hypothetical protein